MKKNLVYKIVLAAGVFAFFITFSYSPKKASAQSPLDFISDITHTMSFGLIPSLSSSQRNPNNYDVRLASAQFGYSGNFSYGGGCYPRTCPQPHPHPIPVHKPVPVPIPKPVPVPIPRPYPSPTPVPIPYPVPSPVPQPYPVPYPVPQPVPQPYPVPVPAPQPIIIPQPQPIVIQQPQPIIISQPQPIIIKTAMPVPVAPQFSVNCSPNVTTSYDIRFVTWTANILGGAEPYTLTWSGTEYPATTNHQTSIYVYYPTYGYKTMNVSVRSADGFVANVACGVVNIIDP